MEIDVLKDRIAYVETVEELKQQFNFSELVELCRNENILQDWLRNHFEGDIADLLTVESDDDELRLLLCEQMEIDVSSLADFDVEAIGRALLKRQKRTLYIDESDEAASGAFVYTQRDLVEAFGVNGGYTLIYLMDGIFRIPIPKSDDDIGANVTYIGRGNAVVEFTGSHDVDLDSVNIVLKNLQVVLKHNINVKHEKSEGLIFLSKEKTALDETLTKQEIYLFLHGKNAFENDAAYAERAIRMQGIAIGETILDSKDYNAEHQLFRLHPVWHMDFLTVVRKFAMERFFTCFVPSPLAQEIYAKKRYQVIYADFCAEKGEAAIASIYLMTSAGRIDIWLVNTPDEIPMEKIGSGSGSCGIGYGINLILSKKDMCIADGKDLSRQHDERFSYT